MKKISLTKTQLATWVTLLVIGFLSAAYFFIYLPANERRVEEQRFRALQNVERNLLTKVDNSIAMTDQLLQAYNDSARLRPELTEYILKYNEDNREKFRLSIPEEVKEDSSDKAGKVSVNKVNGNFLVVNTRSYAGTDGKNVAYKMAVNFSAGQFIGPLLPGDVFDEYIIFYDGKPIYETMPAGISRVFNDSLLSVKNGIWGAIVRNFNTSGKAYKLFLHPVNIGEKECVIGGLLTNSRYQEERAELPSGVVMFLITLVLVIVLSTPWIKLSQMGNKDRLTISDGVITVIVAMLLMSLLFFMFFKYNVPLRGDPSRNEMGKLAEKMVKAFSSDVSTALSKLKALDKIVPGAPDDIVQLNKPGIKFKNGQQVIEQKNIDSVLNGFGVKQVYWLDAEGNEKINWNTELKNNPHGNYKSRPYFSNIMNGRFYQLDNNVGNQFYLDQLVSKTTGSFTTVISTLSSYRGEKNMLHVAGMSFNINSLKNVLLPTGFQYCIIDQGAKVLYHSDSSKNLNENLLFEFSENNKLKGLLEARDSGSFKTTYYSRTYNVFVRPVNNLPYFIVLMEDTSYKETRDMEVFSFTFFGMICFLGFIVIQMLVTFLVSSKRSIFQDHFYNTSWIGPKLSSHRQYNLASMVNLLMILLLVIYLQVSSFLLFIFILLYSVTFLSLFLSFLFARKYRYEKTSSFRYKMNAVTWLLTCICLLLIASWLMLAPINFLKLLSFIAISFLLALPFYYRGDRVINRLSWYKNRWQVKGWDYASSFTLLALTRLLVSSGIPVMFFYITAFNYEQNLDIRYKQLQFGKSLINRLRSSELNESIKNLPAHAIYTDGTWINEAGIIKIDPSVKISSSYTQEDSLALLILNASRVNVNKNAVNNNEMYLSNAADTSFYHNNLLHLNNLSFGTVTLVKTKNPGSYLRLTSQNINYHLPSKLLNAIGFWLLLILSLVIFYITLKTIIVKLFAISMPDLSKWNVFDDTILANASLNNLVFIIGMPGSGKLTRVLEKIKNNQICYGKDDCFTYTGKNDETGDVFVVELMNIPDSGDRDKDPEWVKYEEKIFNTKNRLLIFNHFEYNIQDGATSRIKLNLLEKVMMQNNSRVIILSTIHPVAFLDSIYDHSSPADAKGMPGQDLERWHVLLGHFRIIVFPLQEELTGPANNKLEQLVHEETGRTHFLNKIQDTAIAVGNAMEKKYGSAGVADELAVKLQMSAHYFYMYMWQSLTKEEKFILYDLAEDNLVNSYDDYNLNMLICKGIISRKNGSLKIFNNGFRNFILSAIGNIEAMKIKSQIMDNGNWNQVKYPLYIVFVAIIIFLFSSQQEAYTRLLTYAAAVGTAIPALLKIFSLFDGTRQKSADSTAK